MVAAAPSLASLPAPSRCQEINKTVLPATIALLILTLLPFLHFGIIYRYWTNMNIMVNRQRCTNSCWDTVYKGTYETGIAGYKHIYFNVTTNTFYIWSLTVLAAIALYESLRYLLHLAVTSRLRMSMLILYLAVLYTHYFSWWVFFNYLNDDFYMQWNHQMVFTVTELISTAVVIYLAEWTTQINPRLLLVIISVAVLHMFAAGSDQFVAHVFLGKGWWSMRIRDILLMVPDTFNVVIPMLEWRLWCRQNNKTFSDSMSKSDIVCSVAGIFTVWALLQIL